MMHAPAMQPVTAGAATADDAPTGAGSSLGGLMVILIWIHRQGREWGICQDKVMPRSMAESLVHTLLEIGCFEAGFDYEITAVSQSWSWC